MTNREDRLRGGESNLAVFQDKVPVSGAKEKETQRRKGGLIIVNPTSCIHGINFPVNREEEEGKQEEG